MGEIDDREVNAGAVLRAARGTRGLSQRELAERSGVPRTTIDRIEGNTTVPRIDTMNRLLAAIGFELVAQTDRGLPLPVSEGKLLWRDRAGRHYPSHLEVEPMTSFAQGSSWWGWYRIAWSMGDDVVPPFTFHRRNRWSRPVVGDAGSDYEMSVWDDAT